MSRPEVWRFCLFKCYNGDMPAFLHIGEELRSPFAPSRMKQYLPNWKHTLEHLRICWEQGNEISLDTPFVEWFEKPKRILE